SRPSKKDRRDAHPTFKSGSYLILIPYYLIRNGELSGYTEIEIEVIANLARYHRKNPAKKKHDFFCNSAEKIPGSSK
ncbi:hypothetical protein, partial [Microcoleus sp. AR_TQ3_B6]|uniref:hypothetical protein n=1 Tax=Microcoleus sp. AR_TQ3_B6 TaxID=3055284 RepID=UPI00403F1192